MSRHRAQAARELEFMERALALARRGEGRTSPNPLVGAVAVRAGKVVGAGWHRRLGGEHAESEALRRAGTQARGSTLYVTLEPCNHQGRTPPCVDAIVAAGVKRVVAAMRDPNPDVRGGGIEALRRHGILVEVGLGEKRARTLNESFVVHASRGRPLVRLKCASSLDGRIALSSGESKWITGPIARQEGQRLRRWADAVLVGSGTILSDDPRLTIRAGAFRKTLLRVVADGRLRTPAAARVLRAAGGPVLIATTKSPATPRARLLVRAGAEILRLPPGTRSGIALEQLLRELGRRGVGRLLVEGGGELAAGLVAARLVDRFSFFVAPRLLGADAVAAVAALGIRDLAGAPGLVFESCRRLGRDLLVEARAKS